MSEEPVRPSISVVVPTFRRPDLLARCLGAIERQRGSRIVEVIVVDDGKDDATRACVESIRAGWSRAVRSRLQLRYERPVGKGPAAARNAGWRAAQADLVAFTDDDTVPEPEWLDRGFHAMQAHPEWCAASGQVVVPVTPGTRPTDHALMTQGLAVAEFVTANAFVRRAALARIGGFDERFKRAWREDSDLQFRLLEVGPVGRVVEARVLHPVRPERWGVCIRQQRNAEYEALLYKKHPRLYRERIERRPPWDYHAIVAATVVGVASLAVAAVAGMPGAARAAGAGAGAGSAVGGALAVAGACGGVVALLVARLAWRRIRPTCRTWAHMAEMAATSAVIPYLSVYWRLRGAWQHRVLFV